MTPYPPSDSQGDPLSLSGKGRTLTLKAWAAIALGLALIASGLVWARYQYVQSEAAQCDVHGRVCAELEQE